MVAIKKKENAVGLELRGDLIWQLNSQIKYNHHCKAQYLFNTQIIKEWNTDAKEFLKIFLTSLKFSRHVICLFVANGNCDFHLVLSFMFLKIHFQKIAQTQK